MAVSVLVSVKQITQSPLETHLRPVHHHHDGIYSLYLPLQLSPPLRLLCSSLLAPLPQGHLWPFQGLKDIANTLLQLLIVDILRLSPYAGQPFGLTWPR